MVLGARLALQKLSVVVRGGLGSLFCPLGRRLLSFWESVGVICARCGSKVATRGSDEGKCGQVVPMEVLGNGEYTRFHLFF